ncbi:interferon regulatory factor 3 isoform X2 [Artibeus jamaicensis]|uniref:interferon regulatory factor 3 isoform X2 n=1 Tax=Artibeus jamaicensis TaxID=9417 RepID=UPI00235AAE2B|nr:interferon regulatory factor 3 isoform X2 [Artibeus jamaicensis]
MASQHPLEKIQFAPGIQGPATPAIVFQPLRNSETPYPLSHRWPCQGNSPLKFRPDFPSQVLPAGNHILGLELPYLAVDNVLPCIIRTHGSVRIIHKMMMSIIVPMEDILELLSSIALGSVPDEGPPNLPVTPEYPPQLLLSPNLDIPAPCPNLEPLGNPLKRLIVPEEEWEFEVTAFYRGRQVFQHTVSCPNGLRLVGPDLGDGTLTGQPVPLPEPGALLTDRGVVGYVSRVLSSLGGGLALWRAGQWICARRLGRCHTYWAVGEELLPDTSHGPDGEVPKDKEGGVFNLGPFLTELIAFIEGSGRSPRYTLWFCMGESWPQDQPWTKKLVMVKVVPTCLKALLDMARDGGASSMENTVDLHISNGHSLSLTPDQYKVYLQDLVQDMDFEVSGVV